MRLSLYAHPFDLTALDAHGGLGRLRDLGFAEINLATSYHDGRWLMPWHPATRVRFLEDGTVHFRPRSDYGALRPLPSSEVPAAGPSPLEALANDGKRHGLSVRAWTVFTHNTRLGLLHPEVTVENAFGDRYPYALCPAQPAVRDYTVAMVRDLAAHEGVATIELEALGQMGIKHSSHHDKTSFAPGGLLDVALSACFCSACRTVLAEVGGDPESMRRQVRGVVDRLVHDADAMAPTKPPGKPAELDAETAAWVATVLAARRRTVARTAAAVAQASGSVARAVQLHPSPWFTGSQLSADALAHAEAFAGDERVITAYGEGPAAIEALLGHEALAALPKAASRVCIWPKAPQFASDDDLVRLRDVAAARGVGSIAVYHLGLLPWRTIERVAGVLAR
jgi:hypothetical protein